MSTITTDRDGRTMSVRIENPPHNFMNRVMVAELDEATRSLEGDPSIGAVVITGGVEGRFITHYDIAEIVAGTETVGMEVSSAVAGTALRAVRGAARIPGAQDALGRTPAAGMVELHAIHDLFLRIGRLDKVFIAAINGPALGGGCELALACDLRYMARDAGLIGLPEMTLGFNPGGGGTQRLTHLLGPGRALEMILEAETLKPREALEAGLVHRVVREKGPPRRGVGDRGAPRAPRADLDRGREARRAGGISTAAARRSRDRAQVVFGGGVQAGLPARHARLRRASRCRRRPVVRRRRAQAVARGNGGRPDVGVVELSRRAAAAAPRA